MRFLVLALLVIFLVMAFSMPPVVYVPFILLALFLYFKKKRTELAIMLVSMTLMFFVVEIAVRFVADDIFYREHERWALKTRYRPNIEATVKARFGDLVAMDALLKDALAEPHRIEFTTDGAGYRNLHDYQGEPYVILGDSFAATIGASQENTLVAQLNRRMGNHFYSRGFPGAPKDYEASAIRFQNRVSKDARFVWFMFEGNDFYRPQDGADAPYLPDFKSEWQDYLSPNRLPFLTTRVVNLMLKTARAKRKQPQESPVAVYEVAGKKIAFLKRYMEFAAAPDLELRMLATPQIMEKTACVFLIPEKYRVYKPWIDGPAVSEPSAALKSLQARFNPLHIPVVDLTPALQKAAAAAIKDGRFVYWRDDTHWNSAGIASIVDAVEGCVAKDKLRKKQ